MAQGMRGSIKRVIIELEDGRGFVVPNAEIERAEMITESEYEDFAVEGDPVIHSIFREPIVKLLLVLVSDELSVYHNVYPKELDSGPDLLEGG